MDPTTSTTTQDDRLKELEAPLLRYAASLGLSTHDAEEAVQEGLVALARTMDKASEAIRNPKAYAFTIVRNLANRHFRMAARRNEVEMPEEHAETPELPDKFDDPLLKETFRDAFANLSAVERSLLERYYVERWTYEQIGAELGCSAQNAWKTIKKIVSQILAGEVRKALTKADPDFAKELFRHSEHE